MLIKKKAYLNMFSHFVNNDETTLQFIHLGNMNPTI